MRPPEFLSSILKVQKWLAISVVQRYLWTTMIDQKPVFGSEMVQEDLKRKRGTVKWQDIW